VHRHRIESSIKKAIAVETSSDSICIKVSWVLPVSADADTAF
jgi:hypothetical protein